MPSQPPRSVAPPREGLLLLAFTGTLVLTMLGPLVTMSDLPGLGENSSVRQISYLAILAITIFALRPTLDVKRLWSIPKPLVIALAWCWLTAVWAIDKRVAVSHLALTTIIMWTIFTNVRFLGYERVMLILRMVLLVFMVVNTAAVILVPDFAIHQINDPDDKTLIGDWRGIMMHKNLLGAFAATVILSFSFDCPKFPAIVRIITISAAAMMLMQSGSKTSFGMTIGALAIGFIFLTYDVRYRPLALGTVGILSLGAILVGFLYRDPLQVSLTNPTAFTGRPLIWKAVAAYALDHPFTGSGYGSFWAIGPDSPIFQYASGWVTTVFSTHNGFLALFAEVGLPGLLLVIYAMLIWPFGRLLGAKAMEGPRSALIVSFLFFGIGHNGTETSLFDRDVLINVILLLSVAIITWGGRARSAATFSFELSSKLLRS